jgi:hypothetical protein
MIGIDFQRHFVQLGAHLRRHGVYAVRSIQCNRGDTGRHFKIQRLVTHSSFLLDSVVFLLAEI